MGNILGILSLSPESSMDRGTLCAATFFIAGWGCWQHWQRYRVLWQAILPTIAGLLFGLIAISWHGHQLDIKKHEQNNLQKISNLQRGFKQNWDQFQGIVADREDRSDSVRLWIAQGRITERNWQTSEPVNFLPIRLTLIKYTPVTGKNLFSLQYNFERCLTVLPNKNC